MNRVRWTSWLLVVALAAQFSGALRGLHEATAHGGDACFMCAPASEAAEGQDHDPTPEPTAPKQDHKDCELCFFLAHGVVFADDASGAASLPMPISGKVLLVDVSLCERVGVFVLRSRGPPAARG